MAAQIVKGMLDEKRGMVPVLCLFEDGEPHIITDAEGGSLFLTEIGEGVLCMSPLTSLHWTQYHPGDEASAEGVGRLLRLGIATEEFAYQLVNPATGKAVPVMYFREHLEDGKSAGWEILNETPEELHS